MLLAILAAAILQYPATVLAVIDGDTIKVSVAGWAAPWNPINVRINGVDTPEHVMPPAKSRCEVALGLKAQVDARAIVHPGASVTLNYQVGTHDKYDRLLARVTLPDGSDFGARMVASGDARAYAGGTKAKWC